MAELIASLTEQERLKELGHLTEEEAELLLWDWRFWARPNQMQPPGDWVNWLVLAGRGFGKTRMGSEWVREEVCGSTPMGRGKRGRIALIAETAADGRDVMVEGESGILAVHPKAFRPLYEPSKRRLTWPNGAVATIYNAVEPDQLRGPQHDGAWCDELAKWRYAQATWDNMKFGLRLGDHPRCVITTTPRPVPLVKDLLKDTSTHITRGSTYQNASNLAASFIKQIEDRYAGTRLGRQELDAEVLDDAPGALWQRSMFDKNRVAADKMPKMQRIVVAIDPAASEGGSGELDRGAETGIIAAGLGVDGRGYVFEDASCALGPNGWARRAVECFDRNKADRIVAEINQGGAMVEATLRTVRDIIPVTTVHASRGKVTRAEPIAALYEQGRVSHVGAFPVLEDQMVLVTPFGIEGDITADRMDALVWALTELFPQIVHHRDKTRPATKKSDGWDDDDDRKGSNWKTI